MTIETLTLRPSAPAFSRDGTVVFGVQSMLSGPPRMLLMADVGGVELQPRWLALGDTLETGDTTWRFEDVHFTGPDRWVATVRSVPPGADPFTPPPLTGDRDWTTAELRPAGRVDEAAVAALEERLGLPRLPDAYRRWLAENNGAAPAEPVHVPGFRFRLSPARPLLGIHPDEPYRDLDLGPKRGPEWFTADHVVIAVASGGLLGVRVTAPGLDTVVFLDELGAAHGAPPLETVAPDIYSFCAYLQPAPAVAPAVLAEQGSETREPVGVEIVDVDPADLYPDLDLVDLTGSVLAFADEARAAMCAQFGVRYIPEVAQLARSGRITRRGQCANGMRYEIHGNGYDVVAADGTPLTLQGTGYAPAGRRAGPDDGLADVIDLYALQAFLEESVGTRFDLDALAAACDDPVRRGGLRPLGDLRYALPPVAPPPPA